MKFAIPFKLNYALNDKADEFNISFDEKKNDFNKLIDFIQEYPDKRINVQYRNAVDHSTAIALTKIAENVYFRLKGVDIQQIGRLKEGSCRFFFDSDYSASSFSDLQSFADMMGVTDVFISDDLCYDLPHVKRYCESKGISVRLVLNYVPISIGHVNPTLPIWMPQDYDTLDKYIDVAEFSCGKGDSYDFKKLDVLYKVWFEKKDWAGNIQEINENMPFAYYPRTIMPGLTESKIKCGLACVREGSKCTKCHQALELSHTLLEKQMQFDRSK